MTILTPYLVDNPDLVFDSVSASKIGGYRIKDQPEESRPREKMVRQGAAALSVPELVAILLNTGTVKEDVLSMAHRIVKDYGEQILSRKMDPQTLAHELDIPIGKACQIVACAELGRRFFEKQSSGVAVIRDAEDAYEYLSDMRTLTKEHLRGIYLDTHHRVIHDEVISIGTLNSNLVHPREVFKPAVSYGAAAVILAHNHPSGVPTPSAVDREITQKLVEAGRLMGIPLIDHIIIGADSFKSIDVAYA